jgi:hypothetical protein
MVRLAPKQMVAVAAMALLGTACGDGTRPGAAAAPERISTEAAADGPLRMVQATLDQAIASVDTALAEIDAAQGDVEDGD